MKVIRGLLQIVLIVAFLVAIAALVGFAACKPSEELLDLWNLLIPHSPNGIISLVITIYTSLLGARLGFILLGFLGIFSQVLSITGILLRGRSRWAYRILVYPMLLLSAIAMVESLSTASIAAIAYLVIAIAIDALP